MTKQQQIDVLKTENEQLRRLLAQTIADHNAVLAAKDRKLFQINSERAKWEHRARTAQNRSVSSFAERAVAARDEAMRTGKCVALGGA